MIATERQTINPLALATAEPTDDPRFYRAVCPTCYQPYVGQVRLKSAYGSVRTVALVCALCDAHGRTHNLDVLEPQFHLYLDGSAE